jgi:hypothetical protein
MKLHDSSKRHKDLAGISGKIGKQWACAGEPILFSYQG